MNQSDALPHVSAADGSPDTGALEAVFTRCQSELLGTLFLLIGNRDDARDALQEAFVKCWRHRSKAAEVSNLRAWIFRIALNTGRDLRQSAWRRRRQPLPPEETMIQSTHAGPDAQAEQAEQLALVRKAVGDLRPEEQEVFLLRQNGQLTYDEIAEALAIPTSTVKTRMRLALVNLRKVLVAP